MPRKKYALPAQPRAVVTGGGDGIGKAFAEALGARGGRVMVADIEREGAEAVAEQVTRLGGVGVAIECDVANGEQVARLAEAAQQEFGGVDIVVNNAGVAIAGAVGEVSLEDWK